jgi:hypothetical protein
MRVTVWGIDFRHTVDLSLVRARPRNWHLLLALALTPPAHHSKEKLACLRSWNLFCYVVSQFSTTEMDRLF